MINELKQKRGKLIDDMEAILATAKTESRGLNADETSKWESLSTQVDNMEKEIKMHERQESLNKSSFKGLKNDLSENEKRDISKYNVFKALDQYSSRSLDGIEKELHDEAGKLYGGKSERGLRVPYHLFMRDTALTTSTLGNFKKIDQGGLSIRNSFQHLEDLGVTFYRGLEGVFELPYMAEMVATFPGEGVATDEGTVGDLKITLEPNRVGVHNTFSKESLAQTSSQVQSAMLQSFLDAIMKAVEKRLYSQIISIDSGATGYETTDTAIQPDLKVMTDLEAAIKGEGSAYVTTRAIKAYLKQTPTDDGSGIMIWSRDNDVNGYPAYATELAPDSLGTGNDQSAMIFGDWSQAAIGDWGVMELLMDPYSRAEEGEIKVHAHGIFDAKIHNPEAFTYAGNLKVVLST